MTATRLDSAGRTGLEPASALESRAHAAGGLPTIVLVHGAWAEPAGWDEVAAGLQEDGHATRTQPLGLQSSAGPLSGPLYAVPISPSLARSTPRSDRALSRPRRGGLVPLSGPLSGPVAPASTASALRDDRRRGARPRTLSITTTPTPLCEPSVVSGRRRRCEGR